MTLPREDHREARDRADRAEHASDRLDGRARELEVVPHEIDVAALAAEVVLHVDDHQRGAGGLDRPVIRPGVRIGSDRRLDF